MKKIFPKLVLIITFLVSVVNIITATDFGYESATHTKYAVIINGGGDADRNYVRYWNDCYAVYKTLINNGYQSNNIYVYMADGTIGYYNIINTICHSRSLDLNGDGHNDIQAATLDNINDIFANLSSYMTSNDDLFIYITGPGGRNTTTGHSHIVLWDEESISDIAFAQMLASLHYRTINIVMQQSYAGGFIDDVMTLDNIVITTACDSIEEARPMARNNFSEFTFRWLSAINADSPYHTISCNACSIPDFNHNNEYLSDCIIDISGDYNGDGSVTMEEAFNYAKQYDKAAEHPQLESNPGCLSRALALDTLLYSEDCSAALIEGWDLYMQDNLNDYGAEPNLTTNEYWLTDDIWFEQNGVRVEVLESDQTYDFCVRVRNRGAMTSPANAVLYAHWTKSRIGGGWPWGWNGDYYNCNGTPVRRGDLVGSYNLPPIEGGKTYVARIPWITPSNEEFSSCFEFSGAELNELWHYCALARIVDSQEQPDETITNMDFQDFVLDFNNVVSRNVTILGTQTNNHLNTSSTGVVGLANPLFEEYSGPYTLKFDIDGIDDLDQFANVTLTFPSSFYNLQTDMTWQNCYNNGYGYFTLYDSARFDNIYFAANDYNFYPLVLDVEYAEYSPNLYYKFDIYLTLEDVSGVFVGGEKFQFWNYPQGMANSIRTRDLPIEEDNSIEQQRSILPEDILYVDVYNAQGQLLMRAQSENIGSLNLPNGIYILRKVGDKMSFSVKIIK